MVPANDEMVGWPLILTCRLKQIVKLAADGMVLDDGWIKDISLSAMGWWYMG